MVRENQLTQDESVSRKNLQKGVILKELKGYNIITGWIYKGTTDKSEVVSDKSLSEKQT